MEKLKNISLNISRIFDIAKKDKWVVEYDSDLDSFYWINPKISKSAMLKKFLSDFSLYITPTGKIQGLFIEYAKYNFIAHNKEYEKLIEIMEKVDGDKYMLPRKKEKEAESFLRNIANQVGNETLEVIERGFSLKEVVNAS